MYRTDLIEKLQHGYRLKENVIFSTCITGYSIETAFIHLKSDGMLTLDSSYVWDGATKAPDIDAVLLPSALHDAGYRLIRFNKLPLKEKGKIDRAFRDEILKFADGKSWPTKLKIKVIAEIYYTGVRWFGGIGL